jgi:hypothetical protein
MKKIINHDKLKLLFLNILVFSVLYLFLDDSHFNGVNIVEDKIEDKILSKEVDKKVQEFEEFNTKNDETEVASKENIKKVEKVIQSKRKIAPFYVTYFDRLYFSTTTACLLGYGDVYPFSIYCKLFVMIQSLITVSIIVY